MTPEEMQALPVAMARVPLYWVGEAAFVPGDPIPQVVDMAQGIGAAGWLWEHRREIGEPGDII